MGIFKRINSTGMRNLYLIIKVLVIAVVLSSCQRSHPDPDSVLIKGATIINPGVETEIIEPGYIFFNENGIIAYGAMEDLPATLVAATNIDAAGKYVVPGLVDGFATINNQAYANAYLYKGITTLITVDGFRRGPFFGSGNPSPDLYRLESVGWEPTPDKQLLHQVDSLHDLGFKVLLMMYGLTPEQAKMVYEQAKSLKMATIGELGHTTYQQGMDIGIDAFVHTTRYSLDVAPPNMVLAVANEPFSNELNSPKWQYYNYLTRLPAGDSALLAHAKNLAASGSYIMPTMSLSYLDLPFAENPWNDPVAVILDPADINRPANRDTGRHDIDSVEQKAYADLIANETQVIEPAYYQAGAQYLAGSATDVWGTMPGISLHNELMLLNTQAGLSNEETLAAATVNFSKAFDWPIGRIKPGFEADLLILNSNPLDNLKNLTDIEQMFSNGVEINRESLLKLKP
jgi:hypothetical protein